MAANIHVANMGQVKVNSVGAVVEKTQATIAQVMVADTVSRVLPQADNANTAGHPTLEAYLQREFDDGFTLIHLDQYTVITMRP